MEDLEMNNIFQAMEQAAAMFRDVAPVMWAYYSNLMKQGFTSEQAFELTKEMQKTIFNQKGDE
jgi:hypothetical protein